MDVIHVKFNTGNRLKLLLFCYYGLVSVFLDLDHVIPLLQQGLPITVENLLTRAGRPLHIPILIIIGIVCIYFGSLITRLLWVVK